MTATTAKPLRDGYYTPTPYLIIDDAASAIDFYKKAFGATERTRIATPSGQIGHAELEIGDSLIMLCDPLPHFVGRPPKALGRTSVEVFVYVEDVDAAVRQAVGAGATLTMEVADQFWGDRRGAITDPFGHVWLIATHVEDLTAEEIAERAKAAIGL